MKVRDVAGSNLKNTRNYWVFGVCPTSGILETRKNNVSETGSISCLKCKGKTPTQLRPLERANINHCLIQ
jgi:hypothetical protein